MAEQLSPDQELDVLRHEFDSRTLALKGLADQFERRRMMVSIDWLLDDVLELKPDFIGAAV